MVELSGTALPSDATKSSRVDRYRTANLLRAGLARLNEIGQAGRKLRADGFVTISPDGMSVEPRGGKTKTVVDRKVIGALRQAVAKFPGKRVALSFAGNTGLDLSFRIPNGPIPELRKMIEEEIRFRSPFQTGEYVTAWSANETEAGDWQIRGFVALKSVAEPLLEELRGVGLTLVEFRRENGDKSFSATPDWLAAGPKAQKKKNKITSATTGAPRVLVILGIAAVAFLASSIAHVIVQNGKLSTLEAEANQARATIAAEAQARSSRAAFDGLRTRSYRMIWLVGALTEALPDGTWLDQITVEENELTITGFGPSAAEVTRLLGSTPSLTEVRFASPITRDNTQNLERFRIAATIEEPVE